MNLKICCSTQAAVSLTIKFFDNNKNEIKTLSGNFLNVNDNAILEQDIIDYFKTQNIEINPNHWTLPSIVRPNDECRIFLKEGILNNNFQTSLAPEYEEDKYGQRNLKKKYEYGYVGDVKKIQLKKFFKFVNGEIKVKKGYRDTSFDHSDFYLKEGYIDKGEDTEVIEGYAIDENGEPCQDAQGDLVIKEGYTKDVDGGIKLKEGYTKDFDGGIKLKEGYIKDADGEIKLKEGYTQDGSIDKRYQKVNGVFQLKKGYVQEGLLKGTLIEGYKADDNGDTHLKLEYELDANGKPCLKKGYNQIWVYRGKLIKGYKADDDGNTHLKSEYKLDANGDPCLKFGYALDKQGEPYLKKEVLAIGGVSGLGILGLIVYMFLIRNKSDNKLYMFLIRKKSDNRSVKNNKPILKNEDIKSEKISSLDNLLIENKEI